MEYARRGRNRRAYRRKAARLRRTEDICWLCNQPIDRDLPAIHPMSWTADHEHALAAGGDIMGDIRAAHRRCNSRRQTATPTHQPAPSRDW